MKLVRLVTVVICSVTIAVAVGAWGSSQRGSAAKSKPIKIAAAIALSGTWASYDQPALAGMKLAVKELNSKGGLLGHKVTLSVANTESDPSQAVIATKAALQGNPSVLVAACDTDEAVPQGQLAQKAKVPTFSTCATSPTLTTSVGNYMFGNFVSDNFEAAAAAKWAIAKGYKRAFLLTSADSSYTTNVPKYFGEAFTKRGGKVVGKAAFSLSQVDFTPLITQIKNQSPRPSVIETAMFEPAFPAFMKQLRAAGVTTPVLGSVGIATPTVVAGGPSMQGVVFPTEDFPQPGNGQTALDAKIKAAAGANDVTAFATRGYDLIYTIAAAVRTANSSDPTKIRNAVAALKNLKEVGGTVSYSYRGATGLPVINPIFIVQVHQGHEKLLSKINVNPSEIPKP